jgi:DNA (cytosine-5)-methyltransferase 1
MSDNPTKPKRLTLGSLFAGIGGFDLGFERAGFETVWQVEIDDYCRRVLERHFPRAERFGDIRECGAHNLKPVDVICGGFPCQDISEAGKRAGIDGERSGLWSEMFRIAGELRPRFLLVENVPALLRRGVERVLGDLASIGYDAEWDVVGIDAFGASQHRERIWILAYPNNSGLEGPVWAGKPYPPRQERPAAHCEPLRSACGLWPPGPRAVDDIPRMADGPANRMDRLRGLGNAVVPQIAQWIAERIKESLTSEVTTEHG